MWNATGLLNNRPDPTLNLPLFACWSFWPIVVKITSLVLPRLFDQEHIILSAEAYFLNFFKILFYFILFCKDTQNFVYTSVPFTRCTIRMRRISGTWLINFPRTRGEQRTPGAWKQHLAHPVLFVFSQKTDKFWFVANGMWTVCE